MPSLPSKTRRKRITPIANLHENDVWQRTFKLLGLEPLTPFPNSDLFVCAEPSDDEERNMETMVGAAGDAKAVVSSKTGFMDLPAETQSDIFKHASSSDLVALSLVSKHFHDLAAAQLYKHFHIVFPDEDDPSYESPIDGLAGGLDTFVTSDYDYARFLREIKLDTLSGGEKGEKAYKHYTFDVSCGKFMNTLFLLTVKKAKALETFRWDLRVELSRPLFKALHSLPALQKFHLRMHTGHSMYEIPPPLSSISSIDSEDTIATTSYNPSLNFPPSFTSANNKNGWAPKSKVVRDQKAGGEVADAVAKEPPTLSGFKDLKSLAVLDMDNLDYVDEVRDCVRQSFSTLQNLKLSFSEGLAISSRKPPPPLADADGDMTDEEVDEFGNTIVLLAPPVSSPEAGGPAKAYRANEERKIQEGVLARIFGVSVEPQGAKKKDDPEPEKSDGEQKNANKRSDDPGKIWIKDLVDLTTKLTMAVANHQPISTAQKDALAAVEKAARQYVESVEKRKKEDEKKAAETKAQTDTENPGSVKDDRPVLQQTAGDAKVDEKTESPEEKSAGLFSSSKKDRARHADTSDPDDIDLDAPEVVADPDEFDEVGEAEIQTQDQPETFLAADNEKGKSKEPVASITTLSQTHIVIVKELDRMRLDLAALEQESKSVQAEAGRLATSIEASHEPGHPPSSDRAQHELSKLHTKVRNISNQMLQLSNDMEMTQHKLKTLIPESAVMDDYIRTTRGLQLKSLSIYLIPLRASVLTKAVDFGVLQKLTLLNVGSQEKFWVALSKLNADTPIPLCNIFSDNATPALLKLISELPKLEELFLMEGREEGDAPPRRAGDKYIPLRASQMAPKTTVGIEMIRKLALKKHMATLKRLVISNFDGNSWDANEQSIKLICRKGKNLEELAVSMGVRATHVFNQYLPSLINLRAMHILFFRNDDHCPFVVREIRKFVVDCCASNPAMKLEYIALNSTVERIVRRAKKDVKAKAKSKADKEMEKKKREKGKGKAVAPTIGAGSGGLEFVSLDALLVAGLTPPDGDGAMSSSDSEGEDEDKGPGMKLETLEGVRFYDIYGVRIFCKDILGGWL